ncbi:unnamed protein product [Alopecurus aequalis]
MLWSSVYFRHPSASPGSSSDHRRAWVLLDTVAYTDVDEDDDIPQNATTAAATASSGATVEVTFALVDPPAVSSWFVRCTGTTTKRKPAQRASSARVVRAEGSLLLLRVFNNNSDDFFVYSAGSGKPPSLHLLPGPYPRALGGCIKLKPPTEFFSTSYVLHVFSSETERWSSKAAVVDWEDEETDYGSVISHSGGKVVVIDDGGGAGRLVVGWVDLWQGVLTCDVLATDPVMRLIWLPPPCPSNMADQCGGMGYEVTNAQSCRDVTYSDGCFRFAEIDWDDSASEAAIGWTATMWKRPISSSEWSITCTVDPSEITVSGSFSRHLPPELRCGDDEANKMDFHRVMAAAPTLGLRDDDLLHMMCKLKIDDSKAWVLAIDPEKKKLQAVSLFSAERMRFFEPTYIPCSFSSYLGTTENHE